MPQGTPHPFERLAPYIRHYIYQQGWTELRGMQVNAITAVLDTNDHILLAGQTASGKTEAAFLPILTRLDEQPSSSVGVLYIGPLKALINDQFERLDHLLEHADISVTPWHGDVSRSQKHALLKRPQGIIQITPESLEGFFQYRKEHLQALFRDLKFVVIDEVHAFMDSDRGRQVLCLLERLARLTGAKFRRIGLSATLGDYRDAEAWIAGETGTPVTTLEGKTPRRLRMALHHYADKPPSDNAAVNDRLTSVADSYAVEMTDGMTELEIAAAITEATMMQRIYIATRNGKSLVFVNSRHVAERIGGLLQERAARDGLPEIYFVHHGSVSKEYRLAAEDAMREEDRSACTVATVTLELGIDLGELERVVQINAPGSVSSFVQRLGRTGRRGQHGEVLIVTTEPTRDARSHPIEQLPWDLLKAVASIQLYAEERWVEPVDAPTLPLSILYQQSLSILKQRGDLTPAHLAQEVLTLPPFTRVSKEDFRTFLTHLIELDHLEVTETGTLLIGIAAERIVNDYRFLATFEDSNEFTVMHGTKPVGTVAQPPPEGTVMKLAGKTWRVDTFDFKRRTIHVKRAKGRAESRWYGGGPGMHDRVVKRMQDLLCDDVRPKYLSKSALERLEDARVFARATDLLASNYHDTPNGTLVLPWRGTKPFRGLSLHLQAALGTHNVTEPLPGFALLAKAPPMEIQTILDTPQSPSKLLNQIVEHELSRLGKYAVHAPEVLQRRAYLQDFLHLPRQSS